MANMSAAPRRFLIEPALLSEQGAQQSVAVWWRLRDGVRPDHATSASPAFDQDRLAQPLRQMLADRACQRVRRSAWGERINDPPIGIRLRKTWRGRGRQNETRHDGNGQTKWRHGTLRQRMTYSELQILQRPGRKQLIRGDCAMRQPLFDGPSQHAFDRFLVSFEAIRPDV